MLRNKSLRLIRALPKVIGGGKYLVFFLALFLLMGAPPVAATTWNVTADFPGTVFPGTAPNPNGVWSYGYETSLGGTFSPFTTGNYDSNLNNSPYWNTGSGNPDVWKNLGTTTNYGVQSGELALHPGGLFSGSDKPFAVVRWTAPTDIPADSTITISGAFGAGDTGGVSYYILYDNVSSSPLPFEYINESNTKSFNLTRTVSAGDTIEFIVGPDSNGSNYAGNTPLSVTIGLSSVPLPGAVWLLGSGLLGLAGLRRKLRK
jgi:hypothetical protein